MPDTLFTKIITGDIPSYKIYEDEKTFAFLDIYPVQPSHVLVVPKNPVEFVWDLPDVDYQAVMATVKKVALRLREVTGKPYVHCRVVGTDVPHAHVHLIPFTETSELGRIPDTKVEPNHPALQKIAATIAL